MIFWLARYPGGPVGAGLLLLRLSVAASFLALNGWRIGWPNTVSWLRLLALVVAIAVCAGLLTRVTAAFSLLAIVLFVAAGKSQPLLAALHAIDALALILTGPGAWSADALIFGRRTVTLPNRG